MPWRPAATVATERLGQKLIRAHDPPLGLAFLNHVFEPQVTFPVMGILAFGVVPVTQGLDPALPAATVATARHGILERLGIRLETFTAGPFEHKLLHTIRGMGYVLERRSV